MTQDFNAAAFSPAGDGQPVIAFGAHMIRFFAQDTGGRLGMIDATVPPGEGPPLHVHEREDELIRVLAGRFTFWAGEETVTLDAAGCLVLPRGIPHRFRNVGPTEGHLMVVVTPGGFESFFPAVERLRAPDPAAIAAVGRDFGIRFLPNEPASREAA